MRLFAEIKVRKAIALIDSKIATYEDIHNLYEGKNKELKEYEVLTKGTEGFEEQNYFVFDINGSEYFVESIYIEGNKFFSIVEVEEMRRVNYKTMFPEFEFKLN